MRHGDVRGRLRPDPSELEPSELDAPAWALLRAYGVTAGRAALQRALPFYLGLLVVASVVFEGNGVSPADVVAAARRSLGARALLYGMWAIVSFPAIDALLAAPASFFLRALPVARWRLLLLSWAGLLCAELPWSYLWLRGAGIAMGIAATVAAIALVSLLLTRLSRARDRLAAGLVALVILLPESWAARAPWPAWLPLLGVSLPASIIGVYDAWLRAPERAGKVARSALGGPALVALGAGYALMVVRRARASLGRSVGLVALSSVVCVFGARNVQGDVATVAAASLAVALIVGTVGLVGPLLRAEAELGWLVRVCGTRRALQEGAALAPLWLWCVALALGHGAIVAVLIGAPPLLGAKLVALGAGTGACIAPLVLELGRWAIRGDGRDAARLIGSVGLLAIVAATSLVTWGAGALLAGVVLAVLVAARAWRRRARGESDARLPSGDRTKLEGVLRASALCKTFGGRRVLDSVQLSCAPGEVCLVLGENGSGKSTLLRILCGIIEPDSGQVAIQGQELTGGGVAARRLLGYAPDAAEVSLELSVHELLRLVGSLKGQSAGTLEPALALWREQWGLGDAWHRRLSVLSFGQRKRALLLAALIGDPWLLILDEPSNGLDPGGVALVQELIASRLAQGQASVIASNDLAFIEALVATRWRLSQGRLVLDGQRR